MTDSTVSPLLSLPTELRLMIYKKSIRVVERRLQLDKVSIYYRDLDPAMLGCSKLVRNEAFDDMRQTRRRLAPTLILNLNIAEVNKHNPELRTLHAVARMLLGGYHFWKHHGFSEAQLPMGFFHFFCRLEQSTPGQRWKEYLVPCEADVAGFYRRSLRQMTASWSLFIHLRLYWHGSQQPRMRHILDLVRFGDTFGDYDAPHLDFTIVLVVRAEHLSFFEPAVVGPWNDDGIRPRYWVRSLEAMQLR